MPRCRRLLTLGHSYCVAFNRRLAHELSIAGGQRWEVTAAAPAKFKGDLRQIELEQLPGECCKVEPVQARFSGRIHTMFYGDRLRRLLRESWDVVHCWEEPFILAGGQTAWLCPRSARLVFSTFQNQDKHYPAPFNWIEQYAMRRAAGWIAFGRTVEETLTNRKPYAARSRRVIRLGVDTAHFRPDAPAGSAIRRQLGWTGPTPLVVGFLGRFVPEKGLELLMRTLDRLPVPWRALLVGGGPLERKLRDWSKGHGDRVRVVTGVRHHEVPAYLNAMDVLCAPSQTTPQWREQLGRMLLEAFACGVPVLASDSGEIPYVVTNAGLIVGEKAEQDWVDELSNLLENESRREELQQRGLERAHSVFSWPTIAQQHLQFFEELLDTNAA
jgi:glycosyltransferase involved in cell wall biosynthesis